MSDLTKFAAACRQVSTELERARVQGTRRAANLVASRIRAETSKAASDGVLSGVGKTGAAVGVKVETLRNGSLLVAATGPYQLIERDTKAHVMPRRRTGRRRQLLNIPGIGWRASAKHPGTKGKHPFERGVNAAAPKVAGEYQQELHGAMVRAFR